MSQTKDKTGVAFFDSPESLIDKSVLKEFSLEELTELGEMFDRVNDNFRQQHSATNSDTWTHKVEGADNE